jgi:hypothetical protein
LPAEQLGNHVKVVSHQYIDHCTAVGAMVDPRSFEITLVDDDDNDDPMESGSAFSSLSSLPPLTDASQASTPRAAEAISVLDSNDGYNDDDLDAFDDIVELDLSRALTARSHGHATLETRTSPDGDYEDFTDSDDDRVSPAATTSRRRRQARQHRRKKTKDELGAEDEPDYAWLVERFREWAQIPERGRRRGGSRRDFLVSLDKLREVSLAGEPYMIVKLTSLPASRKRDVAHDV